jgi:tetratricopeptide (TPR) repeat protein
LTSSVSARRALRKIPALRSLPGRELESIQDRLVTRSYRSGEVLWRTRGCAGFFGFIQSGEIEVEYRIGGVLVRSIRLRAGDPVLVRSRSGRSRRATVLARAVTDASLCLAPDMRIEQPGQGQAQNGARPRPAAQGMVWLSHAWPLLLILLIVGLARADMARIASGLLYLASNHEEYYPPNDPRSLRLLRYAEQVDAGAAFVYNEEGYRWFQQEKLPEAQFAFVQAVERDPANAPALNNAAITYFTLGDLPLSAEYLRRAVKQDPDNAITRYNLGVILMQQHNDAGAIREFREAGFIDPKAASPHLQQAFLYTQIGNYADAEQRARTAIELDPSQASAHLLLAVALYNQGESVEALASLADTLLLEPDHRVANFYKAHILRRLEQYDAALSILEGLLDTSTDSQESARISVEMEAVRRSLPELETVAR